MSQYNCDWSSIVNERRSHICQLKGRQRKNIQIYHRSWDTSIKGGNTGILDWVKWGILSGYVHTQKYAIYFQM